MKLFKHTVLATAVVLSASLAHANVMTFNLNGSINGTAPSASTNPTWLSAPLTDIGANQVELVMTSALRPQNMLTTGCSISVPASLD